MYSGDTEQGPDGSTQIFVQPLLGCYSRATTLTAALHKIPSKIQEYNAWLDSHDEDIGRSRSSFRVHEVVKGDWPVALGDSVALFDCDRVRLTDEEIEKYVRWLDYSWTDFEDFVRHVPRKAFDWKPNQETRRSIRGIIVHVALVQVWYTWKLRRRGEPRYRYPRGLSYLPHVRKIERDDTSIQTLGLLRKSVTYRLKHLSGKELSQVTYHKPGQWTGRTKPEAWTARKVLRRFLWHEKLHMNTMKKLLVEYQSRT